MDREEREDGVRVAEARRLLPVISQSFFLFCATCVERRVTSGCSSRTDTAGWLPTARSQNEMSLCPNSFQSFWDPSDSFCTQRIYRPVRAVACNWLH